VIRPTSWLVLRAVVFQSRDSTYSMREGLLLAAASKDVEHRGSTVACGGEKAAKSGGTPDAGALSSLIFERQAGAIIKHRS